MHPLEKKVKQSVVGHHLIAAGELVLVGVSAGPDSMALLHALHALSAPLGFRLAAAYVDHGLRPAETGAEQRLVEAAAAGLGIVWRSGRVAVRDYARRQGLSLEHAARELRYRFLADAAAELGAGRLAVAHTADDQAEEMLLRLLRGTARKGLSGMSVLARQQVIRPLLKVTKAEVLAYLGHCDLPYAEDSSNRDLRFLRNRVRLELLPWLAARFNPNIRETLCRTAAVLQDEEELLESMADAAYRRALLPMPSVSPAATGCPVGELRLDMALFAAAPPALRRRLLEKALWDMALRPAARQIEQLLHGAGRPQNGVIAHLAAGVEVSKEEGVLKFVRSQPGPRRRSPGRERADRR